MISPAFAHCQAPVPVLALDAEEARRCPVCIDHPGWAHDDESRRKVADYCRACHGSGTNPLVFAADKAYDRNDQAWFDLLSTESLVELWTIACSPEGAAWDDEVYDALARHDYWEVEPQPLPDIDPVSELAEIIAIATTALAALADEHEGNLRDAVNRIKSKADALADLVARW